jgi:hypothetical protein
MIAAAEVLRSVYAVARLARGDAQAVALLDDSPGGAARSFYAAALLAPVLAVATFLDPSEALPGTGLAAWVVREALIYAIGWMAFPAVVSWLVGPMQREHRFCRFVAAYNWSAVIQVAVLIPAELLARSGVLGAFGEFVMMVAGIAILIYVWFVVKTALEVTGPTAVLLILGDLLLAVTILEWSSAAGAG